MNWKNLRGLLPTGATVLEAGSGAGQWVKFLIDHGFDAHGLDYSTVGVEYAKSTWPELADRFDYGDLRSMPYADNRFDAIVSFGAIEHNEDGIDAPLAEMFRVLRPGGTLYCTVPCMNLVRRAGFAALQDWVVTNPRIRKATGRAPEYSFFEFVYTPDEYREAVESAGFSEVELRALEPMELLGARLRGIPDKAVKRVHRRWPWATTHMFAAVASKPG